MFKRSFADFAQVVARVPELSTLEAAVEFAAAGFAVAPLYGVNDEGGCGCGHRRCQRVGEHPLHTSSELGTACPDRARALWGQQWPESNIGLVTGVNSGVAALRIHRCGGRPPESELAAAYMIPRRVTVAACQMGFPFLASCARDSGRGDTAGTADFALLYFPFRDELGPSRRISAGVFLYAEDGLVPVPPSKAPSGVGYQW